MPRWNNCELSCCFTLKPITSLHIIWLLPTCLKDGGLLNCDGAAEAGAITRWTTWSDENSTARLLLLPFVSIVPRYLQVSVGFVFHYFLHLPSDIMFCLSGFFFFPQLLPSCYLRAQRLWWFIMLCGENRKLDLEKQNQKLSHWHCIKQIIRILIKQKEEVWK